MGQLIRLFFWGMLISFLGSLPLGTMNVAATHIAVQQGVADAMAFCLAATLIEIAYVRVSLVAMSWISRQKKLFRLFEWLTILILLALATGSFIAALQQAGLGKALPLHIAHPFLLGGALSATNPLHISFWFGWSTVLLNKGILCPRRDNYNLYIAGIGLGSLLGYFVFIFGGEYLVNRLNANQNLLNWIIGSVLLLTVIIQLYKMRVKGKEKGGRIRAMAYRLAHWETWHYLAKYIPLAPVWLWHCLRSGSAWFFTPSNPSLTFGGFEGESKMEMFEQLPAGTYPKSVLIPHALAIHELEIKLSAGAFNFPLAVKPDVGMMGFMFRKIDSLEKLIEYHQKMPVDYIIQDLVRWPLEVSVFYYRMPNEKKGAITGFIRKEFLQVTGDGVRTLWELLLDYPRVRFRLEEMRSKHESRLHEIIPAREIFILSNALNLSRGGKLVSLEHEKDERLLGVFDGISHYAGHFYYGRYDIKCASIDALKRGENFSILEYNGCGAEPHHIYGNGNTLFQAYGIVLHHWKMLARISRYNHKMGVPYWGFRRGWVFLRKAKRHFKMLRELDKTTQL
ncbi:MAG: LysE family transporter [Bacteroidota bacterium]|nr:LysE family transporter [Bacteroidota bacterium]MDP4218022.1 LysE family transporter [Bacteroidota bacterium]MDP4247658.1 LysE family transporter [Bacteroidota bacterium]MDP4256874.1 LysE family transporter [Bacteroidota bacterium]